MIRVLRPFLCVCIAIVFAISSVGWSVASARVTAESGAVGHHAAAVGAKVDVDHHHNPHALSDDLAQCNGAGAPCSGEQPQDETSTSCCAMACHIAMQACGPEFIYRAVISDIDRSILAAGLRSTIAARLDRPPRHADATVG